MQPRWQGKFLSRPSSHQTIGKKIRVEGDVNRTRNLLIWSQTRYRCATPPETCKLDNSFRL
ncbi:hypothetical protein GAYE_SCF27MG4660 [Galdieria yellowstonensis]|uniref:Uncharacterized protein n=1 Tax=Galdieria yellowstonensis TaxID=3028027 RepID=A0AAV9IHA4_9RHOD|nr:hypothetical protein GAYE_SCF27MG4660 [Galdieria yellowstonensis]